MSKEAIKDGLSEAVTAVKDIGLASTVVIILAVGTAVSLPKILKEINQIISTILSFVSEQKRVRLKAEEQQKSRSVAIGKRKRKVPPASKLRP